MSSNMNGLNITMLHDILLVKDVVLLAEQIIVSSFCGRAYPYVN